jgi:hypothetical protein
MGETNRLREQGIQFKQLQPGQQIQVDLKNATQKVCECGCKYFIPVVALYTVSALVSPTGQELTAQLPVLICQKCGEAVK